jgi:hypothetical protein
MRKYFIQRAAIRLILLASFISICVITLAQVSVRGPQCVLPGLAYQYTITINGDRDSVLQVCVTGGKLSLGDTCTQIVSNAGFVFVIWDENKFHEINISSSKGNANLPIVGTTELSGGQIDGKDKVQVYDKNKNRYTFRCEDASGGACAPSYSYQWQRSENGLNWTDIENATDRDLQVAAAILVNTFFRRVTIEIKSNSIAYSDQGMLTVNF